MRIAFITPEYRTEKNFDGGLANYLYRMATALKQRGHEPIIVVGTDRTERIDHEGIEVQRVKVILSQNAVIEFLEKFCPNYLLFLLWIWQSARLNWKLMELHANKKIDVAQFTSYSAPALYRPKSIPAVIRISSIQSLLDSEGNFTSSKNKISLAQHFLRKLELWALKKTNILVSPSELIAKKVENLVSRKVTVIESPYFPSISTGDHCIIKNYLAEKRCMLFFGSLSPIKGIQVIAEILPKVFSKHKNLFFVIVGKNLKYRNCTMLDYVFNKASNFKDRIIYFDSLPQTKLFPVIRNAQFIVLPSLIDNLPNTCIEAMGCGKIVIGTRGASFEQLIDDEKNGFLCEINNPDSLFQKIEQVLSLSKEERRSVELSAKKRIEKLDPDIIINQFLKLYEQAIEENHDGS